MPTGTLHALFRGLLLLACAFIGACASLPDDLADTIGPPIGQFELRGRAMLRQDQRIDHLRFDWTHDDASDALLLTTPFGQGMARITRTPDLARVRFADGRQIERTDLAELAAAVFGNPLPLAELSAWLRGAHGQRHGLLNDWEVTVEQVDELKVAGRLHLLPRVITATQGSLSLRLIVDQRGKGND